MAPRFRLFSFPLKEIRRSGLSDTAMHRKTSSRSAAIQVLGRRDLIHQLCSESPLDKAASMKATVENLISAEKAMTSVVAELRDAYAKSEPLVEVVLLPLLNDAVMIEQRLKTLNDAIRRSISGRE